MNADEPRPEADVPQMMGPLWKEHDEPRDGFEPVPFWLKIIMGGFLFWGGWYLATYSGEYRGDVFDQPAPEAARPDQLPQSPEETIELGRRLYANCALCHQAEGTGLAGQYPPLKDSEWVVGDSAKPDRLARIVLFGLKGEITVKGEKFTAHMPAFGTIWKDYQIAAVLSYVRSAWGHKAEPIAPDQVTAARRAEAGRLSNGAAPFTVAELTAK